MTQLTVGWHCDEKNFLHPLQGLSYTFKGEHQYGVIIGTVSAEYDMILTKLDNHKIKSCGLKAGKNSSACSFLNGPWLC